MAVRDSTRPLLTSTCWAPHTSMYFDQHGDVRACCQNITGPVGDIRLQTIREIWDGAANAAARRALEAGGFAPGCDHCEWQERSGASAVRFSRSYDHLGPAEPSPSWPKQMQFSLSNGCNLQCVMCTGWNSSAIRAHREGLPPLPVPYGDSFFEELAEFLPHLEEIVVLGGEPFVARESLHLLEMVADLDDPPDVHVITNGTQWSPRLQSLFERLPMGIEVSLDAATPERFAEIRVGASLEVVLANLDRYRSYARRSGQRVGLSYCLMTSNWSELAGVLELAEQRELDFVSVNQVSAPLVHSLQSLERADLEHVVASMEAQRAELDLTTMLGVWEQHLSALRTRLDDPDWSEQQNVRSSPWAAGASEPARRSREFLAARCRPDEVMEARSDGNHRLVSVAGPLAGTLWPDGDAEGSPLPDVLERAARLLGGALSPAPALSDLPNEYSFRFIAGAKVLAGLRCFMFQDGTELIVVVGIDRN